MYYMNPPILYFECQGYEKYTNGHINSTILLFPNRKTLDVYTLFTEGSHNS